VFYLPVCGYKNNINILIDLLELENEKNRYFNNPNIEYIRTTGGIFK